eukprot:5468343-Pleurochrysis_carterae.AAC.1
MFHDTRSQQRRHMIIARHHKQLCVGMTVLSYVLLLVVLLKELFDSLVYFLCVTTEGMLPEPHV